MAQLCDVLRSGDAFPTELPDGTSTDVLLVYSCFHNKDMEAVLTSRSFGEYLAITHDSDANMKNLLSKCNISIFNTKLPLNYESNKSLHLMLLPVLEKTYSQSRRNIRQAKGVVKFEKALSYVLDKYIFNQDKPYFEEELKELSVLKTCKVTSNLIQYCGREHLNRLFILAEEVKHNLILGDETITPSVLSRGKYLTKIREQIGDIDYAGTMLSCPTSIRKLGFEECLNYALKALGVSYEPVSEEQPEPKPTLTRDNFKEKYLSKGAASEELKEDAWNYAYSLGFNAHMIAARFIDTMTESEAYKQVPKYILEKRGKIDKEEYERFKAKYS